MRELSKVQWKAQSAAVALAGEDGESSPQTEGPKAQSALLTVKQARRSQALFLDSWTQ